MKYYIKKGEDIYLQVQTKWDKDIPGINGLIFIVKELHSTVNATKWTKKCGAVWCRKQLLRKEKYSENEIEVVGIEG